MRKFAFISLFMCAFAFASVPSSAWGLEIVSHSVTVNFDDALGQNVYYIGGVKTPSLELSKGVTYIFDLSNASLLNHPFKFSLTKDGTHGPGVQFTESVKSEGIPGSGGAKLSLTVFSDAKPSIYFYCERHSGMGGNSEPAVLGNSNSLFEGNFSSVAAMLTVPNVYIDSTPATMFSLKLPVNSGGDGFDVSEVRAEELSDQRMVDPLQPRFSVTNNMLVVPRVDVDGKPYEVKLRLAESSFTIFSAQEFASDSVSMAEVVPSADAESSSYGY